MGIAKEFREFALKGNVLDLAVAVVIGAAFGAIVQALVSDILMPSIGLLTGGQNFSDLKYVLSPAEGDKPEAAILYGHFIQTIVDFVIIAWAIFMVIRTFNKLKSRRKKETEAPPAAPPPPTPSEELLAEIRDLLRAQQQARR